MFVKLLCVARVFHLFVLFHCSPSRSVAAFQCNSMQSNANEWNLTLNFSPKNDVGSDLKSHFLTKNDVGSDLTSHFKPKDDVRSDLTSHVMTKNEVRR